MVKQAMRVSKQNALQSAVTNANSWREQLARVHALVMGALALTSEDDLDARELLEMALQDLEDADNRQALMRALELAGAEVAT